MSQKSDWLFWSLGTLSYWISGTKSFIRSQRGGRDHNTGTLMKKYGLNKYWMLQNIIITETSINICIYIFAFFSYNLIEVPLFFLAKNTQLPSVLENSYQLSPVRVGSSLSSSSGIPISYFFQISIHSPILYFTLSFPFYTISC